jgi:hypothetical protein
MAFLRRNSIGIHAQRLSDDIHVTLNREGGLRDAKAAEGAARCVVGVHCVAVDLGAADDIGAGGVRGGARHHLFAQAGIGAAVAVQLSLDRGEHGSVAHGAGLDADDRGVALGVEAQTLLARVEHLDRASVTCAASAA